MSSEWAEFQLDEICDFVNGFAFKPENYIEKSAETYEVFRMGYISRGGGFKEDNSPVFVSRSNPKLDKYRLRRGDIIIAMTDMKDKVAILGNTARVPQDDRFVLNQRAGLIRVSKPDIVCPIFLYYYSNWKPHVDYLRARANSGVQVNLSTGAIKEAKILLPPLMEQRQIGALLSSLDDRITLLRETNATLEAIAQALFKSWFVDFDPVRAKQQGRAPEGMDESTAALFPDAFEESELGLVPKGWRTGIFSEVCSIASGKRPPERSDSLSEQCPIPLYGGAGLMGYSSSTLFNEPKIVTGRVGTLGKVHIAHPPFWASDNVLVISPLDISMFSFTLLWLRSVDVQKLNRGSTQPLLTQRDLGAQPGVIPSQGVLAAFEEIAGNIYQGIRCNDHQAQTLATLRDTLLPRLISGQLRLDDLPPEARS